MIFKWSLKAEDYSQEAFDSYRANDEPKESLDYLWNDLRQVQNYNVSLIQPGKAVVWWCSVLVLTMFIAAIIVSCYVPWILAIVINCVVLIPSGLLIWGAVKKQRKDVMRKFS